MIVPSNGALLAADDPSPARIDNPFGSSPFLLIGDHAGNAIPKSLGTLGLCRQDRERHIAWDIGVEALGCSLAPALDAVFVRQSYSRLVIDCNRDPRSAEAIPEAGDGTAIPGNRGLSAAMREQRREAIHAPYQQAIAAEIDRRRAQAMPTILVSLHSFTPTLDGAARPWHVGVLHSLGSTDFATAFLGALRRLPDLAVGDNEPYRMDETDYTVPLHAFADRLPYAEIEVRQDLLGDQAGIARWTAILRAALTAANSRS